MAFLVKGIFKLQQPFNAMSFEGKGDILPVFGFFWVYLFRYLPFSEFNAELDGVILIDLTLDTNHSLVNWKKKPFLQVYTL